jgi:dCMP deaminase
MQNSASSTQVVTKRTDYLSWDEYFMGVALMSAQRSKDPNTQVGACIVNKRKRIVGVGYNGFPAGCSDDALPWAREGEPLETKYPYVCHAELNAVLNSLEADLSGASIYVALFPCNECAKVIIQANIAEVVYLCDKYAHTDSVRASKRMFDLAGVSCRRLLPSRSAICIDMIAEHQ